MTTLKERYEYNKKLVDLKNKLVLSNGKVKAVDHFNLIETKLLDESKLCNLIVETLDKNDIEQIQKTIDQFDQLVPEGTPLSAAIDGIKAELLKSLQGGLLNKIKSALTPDSAKPLARAMAFVSSLRQGLSQLDTILKTALPKGVDLSKTGDASLNQLINDQEKAKMVQNAFLKAIKPSGLFQVFSAIPYLDSKNAENIAIDLLNMSGTQVMKLVNGAKSVQTPAVTKDDVTSAVNVASGKSAPNTTQSAETSPTSGTTPSKTSTQSTQATKAEPSNSRDQDVKKAFVDQVKKDNDLKYLSGNGDTLNKLADLMLKIVKQPNV